jgi:hypothetical protein
MPRVENAKQSLRQSVTRTEKWGYGISEAGVCLNFGRNGYERAAIHMLKWAFVAGWKDWPQPKVG